MYDMNNMKKLKKYGELAPAAWQGFSTARRSSTGMGGSPASASPSGPLASHL